MAAVAAISMVATASAQTTVPQPKVTAVDTVTVTAPAKASVELTPMVVSVVTSKEIEESTESNLLPVLQGRVPGLFVSERGFAGYGVSGGAAGSVSIRGVGGGNKVLFMIDGQPQFAGVFGHSLPDTYVANGIERVEVVRGPSSLLYGTNAMGGSINLITASAHKEGFSGRTRALFGSFTTQKFATSLSWRQGPLGISAAGQVDRSNGDRPGSPFWLANEYVQARYELSRSWSIGANLTMTQTRADNPGTLQSPLLEMWTKLFRGTGSFFLRNSYAKASGGIQGYINWGANKVDDGHAPDASSRDYWFRSRDYNMGFTAFENFRLFPGSTLSAGFDFVHWGGHSWNQPKEAPDSRTSEFRAHVNDFAPYVMAQQNLFDNILALNAGVRLQHSSQFGNEWVPQAGFLLRPFAGNSLKFSYGKGFRAPNLRELYLYAPANPDLKPEYLSNFEVELRQKALGGRLDAGLALYYINGKDMIQTQRIDGRPRNMNTGSFINKGFELDATFAISRQWSAWANYSYLHTNSADILYAPKNKLNACVTFSPAHWSFEAESQSVWGVRTGGPEKSNYTLLNLKATYTLPVSTPLTLIVDVDNITNKDYEIVYGCPMPGTTVLAGVEIRF